jgi:hypothetical protein
MRRRYQFLTAGIIAVAIVAVVAMGLVSLRDRERIASLESRIVALEKNVLQHPPLEKDGFGKARTITARE